MSSKLPVEQEALDERTHGPYPPGDFYVEEHECVLCGVPAHFAPDLIRHRPELLGSCYFYKQPSTPGELDRAVAAIQNSCVCAVRYRGSDPKILARLPNQSTDRIFPAEFIRSNYTKRPILSISKSGFFETLFKRSK